MGQSFEDFFSLVKFTVISSFSLVCLSLSSLFMDICQKSPSASNIIEFSVDGSWQLATESSGERGGREGGGGGGGGGGEGGREGGREGGSIQCTLYIGSV